MDNKIILASLLALMAFISGFTAGNLNSNPETPQLETNNPGTKTSYSTLKVQGNEKSQVLITNRPRPKSLNQFDSPLIKLFGDKGAGFAFTVAPSDHSDYKYFQEEFFFVSDEYGDMLHTNESNFNYEADIFMQNHSITRVNTLETRNLETETFEIEHSEIPDCTSKNAGHIRFNGSIHLACDGSDWNQLY